VIQAVKIGVVGKRQGVQTGKIDDGFVLKPENLQRLWCLIRKKI
jgi:hypothetical protein